MPLIAVVGGQYGGEGKGLIAAALTNFDHADILIKTGGPNSAHSFGWRGKDYRFRMVPCGTVMGAKTLVFPAGCLIYPPCLFAEIQNTRFNGELLIDPQAGLIDEDCIDVQRQDSFYSTHGSTLTGSGAAVARRALRRLKLACDEPALSTYLVDTAHYIHQALKSGKTVLLEGAQGYGLSNYHGTYPYSTSRDTTVTAFLSQLGLGPGYIDSIVLAVKCFPTRNLPGSGMLREEFSAEFVERFSGELCEVGGGSYNSGDQKRRVGLFDFDLVQKACRANTPTHIALTGLDRLRDLSHIPEIRDRYGLPEEFITTLARNLRIPVGIASWGPNVEDVVDLRRER